MKLKVGKKVELFTNNLVEEAMISQIIKVENFNEKYIKIYLLFGDNRTREYKFENNCLYIKSPHFSFSHDPSPSDFYESYWDLVDNFKDNFFFNKKISSKRNYDFLSFDGRKKFNIEFSFWRNKFKEKNNHWPNFDIESNKRTCICTWLP